MGVIVFSCTNSVLRIANGEEKHWHLAGAIRRRTAKPDPCALWISASLSHDLLGSSLGEWVE
eukprot:scaffold86229_cov19-Tisochrysis_lutea.AAC.1